MPMTSANPPPAGVVAWEKAALEALEGLTTACEWFGQREMGESTTNSELAIFTRLSAAAARIEGVAGLASAPPPPASDLGAKLRETAAEFQAGFNRQFPYSDARCPMATLLEEAAGRLDALTATNARQAASIMEWIAVAQKSASGAIRWQARAQAAEADNLAKDARIKALEGVLTRLLKIIDSGAYRDRTELSISAHPAIDDARETLLALTGGKQDE